MALTDKELKELECLRNLQSSRTIPLMQESYDRLIYLQKKQCDNMCSNPSCEGYEGSENEKVCPKCKSLLFKIN